MFLGIDDNDPETCEESPGEMEQPVDEIMAGDISGLNTSAGQGNPRSLRMFGEIGTQKFQTLIDSESTHNFLKPTIAESLGLKLLNLFRSILVMV